MRIQIFIQLYFATILNQICTFVGKVEKSKMSNIEYVVEGIYHIKLESLV